jgi:GNAT superfamily N-acetyltransferase
MRIEEWSPADTAGTRGAYDVFRAVQAAEDPAAPPMSWHRAQMWLEHPTQPAEMWVVCDEGTSRVTGFYRLEFPQRENRDRTDVMLGVHPEHRRRGTGTALLRHLAERAAKNGRTTLVTFLPQGTPGEAFARHFGAKPGLVATRRALHVTEAARDRAAELHATAVKHAAGYSLVSWSGRTPDERLGQVADLFTVLNDAPHGDGFEDRHWDADRVRTEVDDLLEVVGSRSYQVVAIHDATGEMAAFTQVELDPEIPEWGNQQLTAVTRPHRGHQLGLLVKTAMLEQLAAAEPTIKHIVTGNAAANDHMIAINEALGFEMLYPQAQGFDLPVSAGLAR